MRDISNNNWVYWGPVDARSANSSSKTNFAPCDLIYLGCVAGISNGKHFSEVYAPIDFSS